MVNLFVARPWCLRILLCGGLVFALPLTCWAKSDLDRFDLVGPVHTVVTKHPQLKTTHQFDQQGRLISMELAPTKVPELARYLYVYDDTGRLIEEQTIAADESVAYKKHFAYGSDEQGRMSARIAVTDKGLFTHAEFTLYDGRGFMAEELMITGQGVSEKSLYDVRGNLVYQARYFQGRLVLEATHHHGLFGRLTESRFYGSEGDLMRKDQYRYDQAGNRVEQSSEFYRQSHLKKSVITYEFDQVGNWTKETIQRWSDKNGATAITETVVSREREIVYY